MDPVEYPWEKEVEESRAEEEKVPKVSIDFFLFLGADQVRRITRNSASKMSAKQMKRNLKTANLPVDGGREDLVAWYDKFIRDTLAEEGM